MAIQQLSVSFWIRVTRDCFKNNDKLVLFNIIIKSATCTIHRRRGGWSKRHTIDPISWLDGSTAYCIIRTCAIRGGKYSYSATIQRRITIKFISRYFTQAHAASATRDIRQSSTPYCIAYPWPIIGGTNHINGLGNQKSDTKLHCTLKHYFHIKNVTLVPFTQSV
jgi:hypothetical protein